MRRFTLVGCMANAAALVLLALTGAAVAIPLQISQIPGIISDLSPAGYTYSSAYVDLYTSFFLSDSSSTNLPAVFYAVYAVLSDMLSQSSSSSLIDTGTQLVGYVLGSGLQHAVSGSSSLLDLSGLPPMTIYGAETGTTGGLVNVIASTLTFQASDLVDIPEPSGVAVVVTGVAGVATLVRRWRLRRALHTAAR
jgi:hypothetical protein